MKNDIDNDEDLNGKDIKESLVTEDIKEQIKKDPHKVHKILAIIFVFLFLLAIAITVIIVLTKDSNQDDDKEKKELKFLSWEEAHKLAKIKLRNFTLEEKLSLLYGTKNMQNTDHSDTCVGMIDPIKDKFGGICLQDGPAGVRFSKSTQS